jgi:nucleoid-associated protein YgaU
MTRETKIGLLVGLAFIIVIGILLSDQLMRSTEPPSAPLANVADTLRKATVTPASHNKSTAPPAVSSQDVAPDNAVPTKDEITRRPPPVTFVEIRPASPNSAGQSNEPRGEEMVVVNPAKGTRATATPGATAIPQNPQPIAPPGQAGRAVGLIGADTAANPPHPQSNESTAGKSIADIAAMHGETLIGPDGQPLRARVPLAAKNTPDNSAPAPKPAATGMIEYTVVEGDSLSKMASKLMGGNTKANRDAIMKANPSLAGDPNKVIIGQTYNIPVPTAAAGATAQGHPAQPAAQQQPAPERTAPIKAASAEYWYQVQPGDNLWKIAKEKLGDAATVPAIKELNRDQVKNWDIIPAGTKLRLPSKPIASAQ